MAGPRRLRRRGPARVMLWSGSELRGELRRLEACLDSPQEAGGVGTIDDAVVVRECEVHVRADGDRVCAADLDQTGALDDRSGAEDRGLRKEHDGGVEQRATRTG